MPKMGLLLIAIVFFFLPKAESWCSPSDSGKCELIIRGGRKSTDADQRNIRFLNGKHTNAGAIIVEPMNNEMKFVVGDHADQKPVIRLSKDTLEVSSTTEQSCVINGGMLVKKKLTVENNVVLQNDIPSQSSKTGSFVTKGGIGIGQSLYVGKYITVEGDQDSTNLQTGSLRVKGGIAVSKTALIRDLKVMNTLKLPDGHMEINGKIVVNEGTKAKENVKSNLLQVNGNVGVLGNSIFNNNLLVQGNNGLSGVSLLPSGGLQVFSSTRDAFIDFATKYEPSKPLQDANRLRVLQMGHESSLQVYNGKIVVNRKGHVGIGVVQPTHILHVDGQIRSSMSTIATASDIRLKTHITPVSQTESLETILNLTVRDYTWKKDGRRQRGFIAQEVEKIIPSAVQKVNETEGQHNIEDLRLLNLDPIIVELVGAVQALQKELMEEKSKREALEKIVVAKNGN